MVEGLCPHESKPFNNRNDPENVPTPKTYHATIR
jgi:hypothetical protein